MPGAPTRPDSLPPMASLRAFEASVRLRNLSRAAEELRVTPSAVTQHVRKMEAWAGKPMFRRTGRDVAPTDLAEAALSSLREGFDRITEASRLLRAPRHKRPMVAISAPPSFVGKWLLPRLERFRSLHPDIEIWVSADVGLVDFSTSEVDLAIRFGPGGYAGLVAAQILTESAIPVAAPTLLATYGPIRTAADILAAPLLHDTGSGADPTYPSWRTWFRDRGIDDVRTLDGPRYNDSGLAMAEAVAGLGIALAKRNIAEIDIRAGRLTPLLNDATVLQSVYWMVWPQGRTLTPSALAFISWLETETLSSAQNELAPAP